MITEVPRNIAAVVGLNSKRYHPHQPMFDLTHDLDGLRARLARMSDFELQLFGRAAAYLSTTGADLDPEARPLFAGELEEARRVFARQLEEARAEWWRRHPADRESNSW